MLKWTNCDENEHSISITSSISLNILFPSEESSLPEYELSEY